MPTSVILSKSSLINSYPFPDFFFIHSFSKFCVLTGDTGSGKSTQLPQYIYDSFEIYKSVYKNRPGMLFHDFSSLRSLDKTLTMQSFKTDKLSIVVTQPRRVAAMAMARRVCEERGISFGNEISYAIRFDDRCTDNTKLRYVTDGILVRECLNVKNEIKRIVIEILLGP